MLLSWRTEVTGSAFDRATLSLTKFKPSTYRAFRSVSACTASICSFRARTRSGKRQGVINHHRPLANLWTRITA